MLQGSEPWLSTEDIRKGSRWQAEVSEALAKPGAGILCLTKDNLASSWLAFEAGAISNAAIAAEGYVCTYLIDLANADVGLPLGMFQSTTADHDDTWRLVRNLNSRTDPSAPESRLTKLFDTFWPELEQVVVDASRQLVTQETKRTEAEMLQEILETVRGLARNASPALNGGLSDVIKSLADTPGTSTHDLFRRLEREGQRVRAKQVLEKIERFRQAKAGEKSNE